MPSDQRPFTAIDHVQLAMPEGQETAARAFYVDLLDMREIPKPPALAKRGGAWFGSGDVKLHLGVEADFRPARKAHAALSCGDYSALITHLRDHGIAVVLDEQTVDGRAHCYVSDPFGNRIELIDG